MFVILFLASFVLALALSLFIAYISRDAIDSILRRFVGDDAVRAGFEKYIRFGIVVVGIMGGTRVRALQEYIASASWNKTALEAALTQEVWVMEMYRTIVGTLEGLVLLLLICILLAFIVPAVNRMLKGAPQEIRESQKKSPERPASPSR
ncbi:MAG TPA: hypothetical protein VEI73_15680 [Candidatus Acidoferrum sp.]|nr:hypothetical protein [Candidatus Acidoferrum sp.]